MRELLVTKLILGLFERAGSDEAYTRELYGSPCWYDSRIVVASSIMFMLGLWRFGTACSGSDPRATP